MFFRRDVQKTLGFSDWLEKARAAGFTVESTGTDKAKVSRKGVAALIEAGPGGFPKLVESGGIEIGKEIARLVDGGFQKFIQTPSGKRRAALAGDLSAIHNFEEDLRATLCLATAYNQALGTVSNQYIYDRVEDRDHAASPAPWKIATPLKTKA